MLSITCYQRSIKSAFLVASTSHQRSIKDMVVRTLTSPPTRPAPPKSRKSHKTHRPPATALATTHACKIDLVHGCLNELHVGFPLMSSFFAAPVGQCVYSCSSSLLANRQHKSPSQMYIYNIWCISIYIYTCIKKQKQYMYIYIYYDIYEQGWCRLQTAFFKPWSFPCLDMTSAPAPPAFSVSYGPRRGLASPQGFRDLPSNEQFAIENGHL